MWCTKMAQKGALWSSVMITFGPCWHKVKLNWDNIANGSSTIGCWQLENVNVIHWSKIVLVLSIILLYEAF